MVSLIPPAARRIIEPTPGKGNLVAALKEKSLVVVAPRRFEDIPDVFRADCVVMNPPFDKGLEYKFLYRSMQWTNHVIALMPWNTIINADRRADFLRAWGLRSVTRLPRSAFPTIRTQCCILELDHGYKGATELKFISRPA